MAPLVTHEASKAAGSQGPQAPSRHEMPGLEAKGFNMRSASETDKEKYDELDDGFCASGFIDIGSLDNEPWSRLMQGRVEE